MNRNLCVVALALILLFPAASMAQSSVPDVPSKISVPAGHRLLFKYEARGVQIYKAVKNQSGKLDWTLEAPLANLFDGDREAGHHYDSPPSWEAADGSKVTKSGDAISAPAPDPEKDIPWLLVPVKAATDEVGIYSTVVFIQRLQTAGGNAPASAPKRVGTKVGSPYRAVYYFYGAGS
jgi:hypothetical protein